ncbi:MAG: hypothetical protein DRR00_15065 [Candidatus Parabeggiatoa sp. nov. 3]|nr:MAG: hypothetical protein DRR00_15065 [Gammaproteobacteria bacterium]
MLLSTEAQINRYFTAKGNHKGLPLQADRRGNPLWLPLFLVAPLLGCFYLLIKKIPENFWFSTYDENA